MLDEQRGRYEERIRALAAFGHRGSATANEREAGNYLCEQLESMGLDPVREPFAGCRSLGGRILIHVVVAAIGAAFFWHWPVISITFGFFALFSLWREHSTRGAWLSRPLLRFPSANIVARFPTAAPRLRVILNGHYDTQRTGLIWLIFAYFGPLFWWVPAILKPPLLPLALVMVGQIVLGGVALFSGENHSLTTGNLLILAVYAISAVLLAQWAIGPFIQGAGDNASGVAAVLTLGEVWRRQPVEGVELVLLLLGCEEGGLLGSTEWATRHREELRELPTVFLNLDNLGFGPPRFFRSEVPLCGLPVAYPRAMVDMAAETAQELGLEDAGPHSMPGPTDALSFLTRGMQGMSIVSFGKWGFMPTYHRLLDTTAHLDFDAAWQAVVFGWALLQRLVSPKSLQALEDDRAAKKVPHS
jgi:hypothetical protein